MTRPGEKQISCWLPEAVKAEFDYHLVEAKANKTAVLGGLIGDYNQKARAKARAFGKPEFVAEVRR